MDWREQIDPEISVSTDGPTIGSLSLKDLPVLYDERRQTYVPELSGRVECDDINPGHAETASIRVHRPIGIEDPCGAVVTFHGGGFIIGSNRMDDALLDHWCPTLGAVGVSVDYRLAPEDPYPAALDDGMAAWRWLVAAAPRLGIDLRRSGVYGVSTGGALAAAVVLRCLELEELAPSFLLLDSPCLDDRQPWPSNRWSVPVADPATIELGWRAYLGELYGTDDVPATAAPARASDLSGFPPTCVTVGAIDGLLDECRDFASRLVSTGVPAELHVYEGAPHLFAVSHPNSSVAKQCRADQDAWLLNHIK